MPVIRPSRITTTRVHIPIISSIVDEIRMQERSASAGELECWSVEIPEQ
ncbi:MAG: hypothetical protein GY790_21250 [Bacteroidetes bacterium]|nr:hypothetical protein [Bacteroidota bacterium]